MSFLPEGYKKIPSNSDYMTLQDGANTIRILSSAIVGYKYWTKDNKPVRSAERWESQPADIRVEEDGSTKNNIHFWAFVVWNYEESRVQVLEVNQKQIMSQMKALIDNSRWGDPKMYDITITRSGKGFDTEYVVQGNPPIEQAEPKILEAYAKKPVNLNALLENGDPFAGNTGAFQKPTILAEKSAAEKQEVYNETFGPDEVKAEDIPA
jgi:hypothetical protein